MELFDAFAIDVVPRYRNNLIDYLVVSTTTLQPYEDMLCDQCKMEVIFIPSIPDNIEHWQVFNDYARILRFLHSMQEFLDSQINFLVEYMNLGFEYFPNNSLPKGVVPLEIMFNRHDMYKGKHVDQSDEFIEFNIGSKNIARMVKIGKGTTLAEIKRIMNLIREYKYVFSWSYEDLKSYKGDIFQHTIPLKEGAKPFRHK
jgi:hypothetical protein